MATAALMTAAIGTMAGGGCRWLGSRPPGRASGTRTRSARISAANARRGRPSARPRQAGAEVVDAGRPGFRRFPDHGRFR